MVQPVLIGLPYDASSSFLRGAAGGPAGIRAALQSPAGNPWSERHGPAIGADVLDDGGDLALPTTAQAREIIEREVRMVAAEGRPPILLGGDHSVTYPILRAIGPLHPRLTVLHIDAHADLYDEFEGDRYSHACPFARVMEEKLVKQLVQVGIRTLTGHQKDQAERFGVEMIDMRAWADGARPSIAGPVYVSLDLDGLDPAFAPGVSHREPGGLSVRDVLNVLFALNGPIVGADIVEYNPAQDLGGMTAVVAAKFVKELSGLMRRGPSHSLAGLP
ncbi:MAG TPA: agmatinase [Vicinamibacterales bacterium]|nr:agmatinase [Vicinamibacterales bacterium]